MIFGHFWGRYNAILELNVYSWTWTKVPIILEIVFRWFSFFWFLSSSSRTRARAVWSLGDKRATNHHHRQWNQLPNSQTSNSFSSGKTGNFTALLHIPLPGNILPLILENMSCYCTKYSGAFQNVHKINFLLIFFFSSKTWCMTKIVRDHNINFGTRGGKT